MYVWTVSVVDSYFPFLLFLFYFIFFTSLLIFIKNFQKIAKMAHTHGALVLVDNSIMSPVLSQPLELGAGKQYAMVVPLFKNCNTI